MKLIDTLIKEELKLYDIFEIGPLAIELIKGVVYINSEVIKDNIPGSFEIPIGTLLFNHYFTDKHVDVFNYIIELLKDNHIEAMTAIVSFFVNLDRKDLNIWINCGLEKEKTFFSQLIQYLIIDCEISYQDDPHVFHSIFLLEPEHTDWSYLIKIINMDCLMVDICILYCMIDIILNSITIKNICILPVLRIIVINAFNYMKDEDYDDDEMRWFKIELPSRINELENQFSATTIVINSRIETLEKRVDKLEILVAQLTTK